MLPQFLIVGAQKSGTTSLADALGRHPGVFVSEPREPEYFSRAAKGEEGMTWDEYQALFSSAEEGACCGEASTGTMLDPATIPLVSERLPGVRLIAILRNPAERAYSGYVHDMKKGRISAGQGAGLFREEAGRYLAGDDRSDFDWFARSEYGRQLEPFAEHFGDRLRIVIFEELVRAPEETLNELVDFLGLPTTPLALSRENQTRVPKGPVTEAVVALGRRIVGPVRRSLGEKGYRRFRERIMERLGKRLAPLEDDLKQRLLEERFRPEIARVEQLLGRSISCW